MLRSSPQQHDQADLNRAGRCATSCCSGTTPPTGFKSCSRVSGGGITRAKEEDFGTDKPPLSVCATIW